MFARLPVLLEPLTGPERPPVLRLLVLILVRLRAFPLPVLRLNLSFVSSLFFGLFLYLRLCFFLELI